MTTLIIGDSCWNSDIGPDAQAAVADLQLVAENDQYGTVKQAARTALTKIRRKR